MEIKETKETENVRSSGEKRGLWSRSEESEGKKESSQRSQDGCQVTEPAQEFWLDSSLTDTEERRETPPPSAAGGGADGRQLSGGRALETRSAAGQRIGGS